MIGPDVNTPEIIYSESIANIYFWPNNKVLSNGDIFTAGVICVCLHSRT